MVIIKDFNQVLMENANNFIEKIDMTSTANVIYEGFAQLQSLTSESKWQIKRTDTSTLNTDYADGNDFFDNIWDDRTSLSYL